MITYLVLNNFTSKATARVKFSVIQQLGPQSQTRFVQWRRDDHDQRAQLPVATTAARLVSRTLMGPSLASA